MARCERPTTTRFLRSTTASRLATACSRLMEATDGVAFALDASPDAPRILRVAHGTHRSRRCSRSRWRRGRTCRRRRVHDPRAHHDVFRFGAAQARCAATPRQPSSWWPPPRLPLTECRAVRAPWKRNERSPIAGVKSTSYAENVVIVQFARAKGADEALIANTHGYLCEGTGSNVFVERGGEIVTPPLAFGMPSGHYPRTRARMGRQGEFARSRRRSWRIRDGGTRRGGCGNRLRRGDVVDTPRATPRGARWQGVWSAGRC